MIRPRPLRPLSEPFAVTETVPLFAAELHHDLLVQMAGARNRGELTPARVHEWHDRLRRHTAGAIDAPDRLDHDLRELRRYLCSMAIDMRMLGLARSLLAQSRPPDMQDPPRQDLPPASDDERVRWLNLRGMLLDASGALDAARDAFAEAGEHYVRQQDPHPHRFAVLTNAVQSAYELGDDRRGARLLAEAGRIADRFAPSDDIAFDMAAARLYPALFSGDAGAFASGLPEVERLAQATRPAMLPAIRRFAALSWLQLGDLDRALSALPAQPSPTDLRAEQVPDTLVRLQVQFAAGRVAPELANLGLQLLGHPESTEHDWALCGALAQALFVQGRVGAATLMATLFLRALDTMVETLPQRRGVGNQKRQSILGVFDALQRALVSANYLRAAEDLSALHQSLLHGCAVPKGAFANWAPSAELASAADTARSMQAAARAGQAAADAFAAFVSAQELGQIATATVSPGQARADLRLGFLLDGGRLMRLVFTGAACTATAVAMPLSVLADHAQRLHRAMRQKRDAPESRAALGAVLLDPVATRIAAAPGIEIAPFGPVAALPFAALPVNGLPLGAGRAVTIRAGTRPAPAEASDRSPGTALRVAFALGARDQALSAPATEAQEIAALHAQDPGPLAEFNRASLMALLADRPRILHIGAHFRMVEHDLGASELIGAGGEAIALRQIFNRSLDLGATDLVFLAGCDSVGLSGMDSFASHLIALGARHVIAALWPVDDLATQALSVATHAALARGLPPPEALALAQDQMRTDPRYGAPHHWAAFQCYRG
ncbi:CHAT domain-containing protein [Roseovarius sp. MBR-6]|uniref:CHAT domain-containing protein n=1 Tax=Roseovarius sp. MBR-6 TaxID=3156459 RepID=UPI0033942873